MSVQLSLPPFTDPNMPPPLSSSAPTGRRSLAPRFPPARTPRPERGWLSSLFGGGGTEGAPPHTPPTPPKGLSAEPLFARRPVREVAGRGGTSGAEGERGWGCGGAWAPTAGGKGRGGSQQRNAAHSFPPPPLSPQHRKPGAPAAALPSYKSHVLADGTGTAEGRGAGAPLAAAAPRPPARAHGHAPQTLGHPPGRARAAPHRSPACGSGRAARCLQFPRSDRPRRSLGSSGSSRPAPSRSGEDHIVLRRLGRGTGTGSKGKKGRGGSE